jgi:hypothetical protein
LVDAADDAADVAASMLADDADENWFISLVLITSHGQPATAVPTPANSAAKNRARSDSSSPKKSHTTRFEWSYVAIPHAFTTTARVTFADMPFEKAIVPS